MTTTRKTSPVIRWTLALATLAGLAVMLVSFAASAGQASFAGSNRSAAMAEVTAPAAECEVVEFRADAGWGYGGGAWAEESGDGQIVGYAAEEDSTIYTTAICAR